MNIGILNADHVHPNLAPIHGEYPAMFRALFERVSDKINIASYDVLEGHYPNHIHEMDGYVITGSKASVYDEEPWIETLGHFVQALHAAQKKLVGICFGHQLIAHYLGGETCKSDAGWGIGTRNTALQNGDTFKLLYSHQDQVITPPTDAKILAGDAFCHYSIIGIGDHILSFQGHREFSAAYASGLMELRRAVYPADTYDLARASLSEETDSNAAAQWILDFFQHSD